MTTFVLNYRKYRIVTTKRYIIIIVTIVIHCCCFFFIVLLLPKHFFHRNLCAGVFAAFSTLEGLRSAVRPRLSSDAISPRRLYSLYYITYYNVLKLKRIIQFLVDRRHELMINIDNNKYNAIINPERLPPLEMTALTILLKSKRLCFIRCDYFLWYIILVIVLLWLNIRRRRYIL